MVAYGMRYQLGASSAVQDSAASTSVTPRTALPWGAARLEHLNKKAPLAQHSLGERRDSSA